MDCHGRNRWKNSLRMVLGLALVLALFFNEEWAFGDQALFRIPVKTIEGKLLKIGSFEGKVLLFVNTASRCGYTPQYRALEKLYERYRDSGLVVLGFPSNDFGGQEPGSNQEIRYFCNSAYSVSFPLFEKGTSSEAWLNLFIKNS